MPTVRFTSALKRFFPSLSEVVVEAESIKALLEKLDIQYPGIRGYLVDEQGVMRKHVNIYIGNDLIKDRDGLSDPLKMNDEVLIFQALSGG